MRAKMWLLRITPIVVLILQLYGARGDLPMLPADNRLLPGAATYLPGAELIDCKEGDVIFSDFKRKNTLKPSEALADSNFKKYAFTTHAVVPDGILSLTHGGVGVFSVAKVEYGLIRPRTAFALQVDGSGDSAYWLPQGGFVDIAKTPTSRDPKYVFTADYSGCSWTVTPMNNGMLRLRHVEGGYEDAQFNDLSEAQKGGPTSYAMQYNDYGYIHKHGKLIQHVTGFAYMKFSNGKWTLHVQHQTCAPRPGYFVYENGEIEILKMNYYNQSRYSEVTGTEFFNIPQPSQSICT